MSYDVSVWCTKSFDDPAQLPAAENWTVGDGYWSYDGGTWLLNTGPSLRVLEEDIPDEVLGLLPGIGHVTHISLEPIGAPKAGRAMLQRVAREIAKTSHGVILDPQEDSVELPRGIKRFLPPKSAGAPGFALLQMSWWFDHARVLEPDWIDAFLALLERCVPEALPKRYGLWEPPQHVFEETGREHLMAFLSEHMGEVIVWYANRPAVGCSFSVKPSCEWLRTGDRTQWRCNHASISVEAVALSQPGWPVALHRLWRQMSLLLRPFFGDLRTLHGFDGRPPRVFHTAETESNPTSSWFWKGIPPRLGHALVVGHPYIDVWPELAPRAELHEDLLFASTDDWTSPQDVAELVGGVPPTIALPFMPFRSRESFMDVYPQTYPEVFPFGDLPSGVKRWDGRLPLELQQGSRASWRFWSRGTDR